ncbi:MAG: cupin domain-containing protein [Actinomycetota bacterium]
MQAPSIDGAQVVLPATEPLSACIDFFTALGFRVRMIMPADHPRLAVMDGHGMCLRLDADATTPAGTLRLLIDGELPPPATAPNGTVVEFAPATTPVVVPDLVPEFVVTHAPADSDDEFGEGRAGMRYRDLVPSRLGGRFIASHILIPRGGPVADYVHFHRIRFQMIFCHRGWVKVVYEDQGEPMVMHEGDCLLQPSTIRHRVLEASDRMQVVEIGCPAEHETWGDSTTELPTTRVLPERGYGPDGHRFVFHRAETATWAPWRLRGYECRDTGIGIATDGVAGCRVVRPVGSAAPVSAEHSAEFVFGFVLQGGLTLTAEGHVEHRLTEGDSFVVPAGVPHTLSAPTPDLQLLDVTLPGDIA